MTPAMVAGIAVGGMVFGFIGSVINSHKGHSAVVGFLAGALLGPFVLLLLLGGSSSTNACPECKEAVMPDARICKHCGTKFATG